MKKDLEVNVAKHKTLPGAWVVEAIDYEDGAVQQALFSGPGARDLAHEYARIKHGRSPERCAAYEAVDGERDYQVAQKGNAKRHEGQPPMTPGEHLLVMQKCLRDGVVAWYMPDGGQTCLDFVRKVAAVGVACMELHGAPPREARKPVQAQKPVRNRNKVK